MTELRCDQCPVTEEETASHFPVLATGMTIAECPALAVLLLAEFILHSVQECICPVKCQTSDTICGKRIWSGGKGCLKLI